MGLTRRRIPGALMTAAIFTCSAMAQGTTDKAKEDAIKAHTAVAAAAAKEDFKGSLNMCTPPAPAPAQRGARGAGGGQRNSQPPSDVVPPAKAFDNLYFVGLRSVAAWAVNTSDGIILIDALNNAKDAENTIVPGLKALGLDPNQIKYVVITHSHGDHYGGAQYLVDHIHPHLIMSDAD